MRNHYNKVRGYKRKAHSKKQKHVVNKFTQKKILSKPLYVLISVITKSLKLQFFVKPYDIVQIMM